MAKVNVYLTFDGNCEKAFNFYKSVFGGEFPYMGRFNDIPPEEGMPQMDESAGNKIMHVTLPISKETCLMGSDTGEEWGNLYRPGNNYAISINVASKAEADQLFYGLSE